MSFVCFKILQAAALGRAVHVDEVFTQTHIRKGTGEYVDERSRKTIVSKLFNNIQFCTLFSHFQINVTDVFYLI